MAAGGSKRGSGVADPLSGLTRDDVRLVQGHWRAIEQNLAAVGVDVFVTMFTNHPEYQQLFRSLAHLPLEALRRHKALESHGATVMQALTRVVDGLARPDADLRVMRDQGRLHAKWHVKEFHFLTAGQMGLVQSLLWPGYDDPCPHTGLTPRDKAAVRATWQLVRKDVTLNGEALFVMFFETHPEHQKLFTAFAGSAPADLRGDKRLHAHANSVMYAVTSVVDNLDEPDVLVEMLKKLGASHRRHHVPQQGFLDLKGVILRLLSEKLGGKFTPAARQGWDKALDVVNTVVFQGMEGQGGEEASRSP